MFCHLYIISKLLSAIFVKRNTFFVAPWRRMAKNHMVNYVHAHAKFDSGFQYTVHSRKMFLLAFSFENFKSTRGSRGKANTSFSYTAQKKVTPQCSKFADEKARRKIIWGVYTTDVVEFFSKKYQCKVKNCHILGMAYRITDISEKPIYLTHKAVILHHRYYSNHIDVSHIT